MSQVAKNLLAVCDANFYHIFLITRFSLYLPQSSLCCHPSRIAEFFCLFFDKGYLFLVPGWGSYYKASWRQWPHRNTSHSSYDFHRDAPLGSASLTYPLLPHIKKNKMTPLDPSTTSNILGPCYVTDCQYLSALLSVRPLLAGCGGPKRFVLKVPAFGEIGLAIATHTRPRWVQLAFILYLFCYV